MSCSHCLCDIVLGSTIVCVNHMYSIIMMENHHCDTSLLSQVTKRTPAHCAAERGNLKMVQLLHQHGADISLRNTVSNTCTFMLTVSTL